MQENNALISTHFYTSMEIYSLILITCVAPFELLPNLLISLVWLDSAVTILSCTFKNKMWIADQDEGRGPDSTFSANRPVASM